MRPLRLLLDGFGCYRQPTEADFSDVDFFALVGPTGSGKSTLIDGLCFALYGTVPRWGKENAIADALAPAANACRVCLVFELAGKRYAAVRALNRDRQGRVHTKEARLELLDPAVDPGAPIAGILENSTAQLAEGPGPVTAGVEELLGLSYQHFTQSVLLPQGKFAEFLQAKPAERQKLLIKLLAFGVYELIGQRARDRARLAAERTRLAERERGELADATPEAAAAAAARLDALTRLAATVEDQLAALNELARQAEQAAQQARQGRDEAALLAAVRTPAEVPGLAQRISDAENVFTERRGQLGKCEKLAADAELARDRCPDKAAMERLRDAYAEHRRLSAALARQEGDLAARQTAETSAMVTLRTAEEAGERAQAELERTRRGHAAAALAESLAVGADCPVCLRPVTALPHHPAPADLATAKAAVQDAARQRKGATEAHAVAAKAAAGALGTLDGTRQQLDRTAATLDGALCEADVTAALVSIAEAEAAFRRARADAEARRRELAAAEKGRACLEAEENRAWARLRAARDSVVGLGAPAVEDQHLVTAWSALTVWAQAQHAQRTKGQPDLDGAAAALRERVADRTAALTRLLASHGITGAGDPGRAAAAVATQQARAEGRLEAVRRDLERSAKLAEEIRASREDEQVASALGRMLQANSFERWLCSEALDSLVAEASTTLLELSGGQYQLDRDERNELVVIDFEDAGARRPVHTLSGGETFQASLALALALSRQVVALSAGMREENSMFLDEGFGTLDSGTLETVAVTLERLAADSDRMVGIITHVAALAERVPVRFVVSRAGSSSALRKERIA